MVAHALLKGRRLNERDRLLSFAVLGISVLIRHPMYASVQMRPSEERRERTGGSHAVVERLNCSIWMAERIMSKFDVNAHAQACLLNIIIVIRCICPFVDEASKNPGLSSCLVRACTR